MIKSFVKTVVIKSVDIFYTITMDMDGPVNSMSDAFLPLFEAMLDRLEAETELAGVVLTSGKSTFFAGGDLNMLCEVTEETVEDFFNGMCATKAAMRRLEKLDAPVCAAINGAAVGIGATMTCAMDIRLASENAKFGFVFSRRGIVPEACSSYFLPRVVGISQALEWAYSGRVFSAQEALAGGLVKEVLAPEALLPRAQEIAKEIAENTSALSVTLIRHMMWRMLGADHPMEAHKIDSRGVYGTGRGPDAKEGVMSFLEKRPPAFTGKPSTDMPDFFPWWDQRDFG